MKAIATIFVVGFLVFTSGCGGCPISSAPIQALASEYVVVANASIDRDPTLDQTSKTIRVAAGLKLLDALKRAGATLIGGQ